MKQKFLLNVKTKKTIFFEETIKKLRLKKKKNP